MANAGADSVQPRSKPARPGGPVPLDWIEPLSQALIQLRTGISGAKLYTLDSKQYLRMTETVAGAWQTVLDGLGALNINVDHGETVVNGERVVLSAYGALAAKNLEAAMREASLRSLNMSPGLSAQELAVFMQLLARNKFGSTDGKEINRRLHEQGVEHITVNEVTYVAVGEGDAVMGSGGVAGGAGGGTAVGAGTLATSARSILEYDAYQWTENNQ